LRIFANNNRVDLAGEGLDYAIRFGDGAWHGTDAARLLDGLFTPMCAPALAKTLKSPLDLHRHTLLRSYRPGEWTQWFGAAKCREPRITGPIFDSSVGLAHAAAQGAGVALLPGILFADDVSKRRLVRPFEVQVLLGSYWLTSLKSRRVSPAMQTFSDWLTKETSRQRGQESKTARFIFRSRAPRATHP